MNVKHLGHTDFDVILKCFLRSFENYFVKMPTEPKYYKDRWKAAKVNFNMSYGMFDNEKLVGFIINAIDERNGFKIAFNTGTGVLPEYRGKRIVKSIYNYAIPDLIKHDVDKCALEVIVENTIAIKSYESIGFKISKGFKCYSGTINMKPSNLNLKEVGFKDMNWHNLPNQNLYSWDNNYKCLEQGNYRYFQVFDDDIQSYFVINSENGYLAQCDVFNDSETSWNNLFGSIKLISDTVRINNIDDCLIRKIQVVESVGLKNTVNQYEMENIMSSK